jgi:hypothetical protein
MDKSFLIRGLIFLETELSQTLSLPGAEGKRSPAWVLRRLQGYVTLSANMGKEKQNRRTIAAFQSHDSNRPLSALLSQLLVAFTVEFDNEFERRMGELGYAGARLSLVAWSNWIRFISENGVSVRELSALALCEFWARSRYRWEKFHGSREDLLRLPASDGSSSPTSRLSPIRRQNVDRLFA